MIDLVPALQVTSTAGVVVLCVFATPLSAAGRVAVTSFTVMVFLALGGRAMLPGTIYSSNWNWLKICRWLELTGS